MKKTSKPIPDPDSPEWTAAMLARAVPFSGLPKEMQRGLTRRTRGPQKAPTKALVTLRLSQDVLSALRASGRGWQVRADEALRAWVKRQAKKAA